MKAQLVRGTAGNCFYLNNKLIAGVESFNQGKVIQDYITNVSGIFAAIGEDEMLIQIRSWSAERNMHLVPVMQEEVLKEAFNKLIMEDSPMCGGCGEDENLTIAHELDGSIEYHCLTCDNTFM